MRRTAETSSTRSATIDHLPRHPAGVALPPCLPYEGVSGGRPVSCRRIPLRRPLAALPPIAARCAEIDITYRDILRGKSIPAPAEDCAGIAAVGRLD